MLPVPAAAQWAWTSGSGGGGYWANPPVERRPAARPRAASPAVAPSQEMRPRSAYQPQSPRGYAPSYPQYRPEDAPPYPQYAPSQYPSQEIAAPTLAYAPPSAAGHAPRSPLPYADPNSARRLPFVPRPSDVQLAPPAPTPTTAFCVRLCDGRFFPLTTAAAGVAPAKLCSALCPASRTKVFEGAGIEEAAAADGARYAKLATAYLFRKELVANCTCNGKNPLGLARIDIVADPTLQAGDVVATAQGLKVFNGAPGPRHKAANFTPLKKSALVSADLRRTLRGLRVVKN